MKKALGEPWKRRPNVTSSNLKGGNVFAGSNSRNLSDKQPQPADLLMFSRRSMQQRAQGDLKISITNAPSAGLHPYNPTVPKISSVRSTGEQYHSLASYNLSSSRRKQEGDGKGLEQIMTGPPASKHPAMPQPNHHSPLPPIGTKDDDMMLDSDSSTLSASCSSLGSDDSDDMNQEEEFISEESEDDNEGLENSTLLLSDQPEQNNISSSSQPLFADIAFPPLLHTNQEFEATIIQDHAYLDFLKYSASVLASGLGSRIDNIVRGFEVRGPLNKDVLSRAINAVVRKHPLLTIQFHRREGKLYIQNKPEKSSVVLDAPVFSGEKPMDAVVSARRQLFSLPVTEVSNLIEDSWAAEVDQGHTTGEDLSRVVPDENEGLPQVVSKFTRHGVLSKSHLDQNRTLPEELIPKLPRIQSKHCQPLIEASTSNTTETHDQFHTLLRCKLLRKSTHEHYLILSFPRIIGDYWSSALLVQQISDAYAQIEKLSAATVMQRPGRRVGDRVPRRHGNQGTVPPSVIAPRMGYKGPGGGGGRFPRLSSARPKTGQQKLGSTHSVDAVHLRFPSRLHFMQVALREAQHLAAVPKEKLWSFWESTVTVLIRRKNGPPRVKVVPPVRLPSKLGDGKNLMKMSRPKTSRLRPATARFLAGKEPAEGLSGLGGPVSLFHFIRVEESLCEAFRSNFPKDAHQMIKPSRLLRVMTLAAFVVVLGRCCRGWGKPDHVIHQLRGKANGRSGFFHPSKTNVDFQSSTQCILGGSRNAPATKSRVKTAKHGQRSKLDLGSFLLGVEMSPRDFDPENMEGLFGPLTNDVALRVSLSSCERFVDLMVAVEKQLQMAAHHSHYPFKVITEELRITNGLPIKFSYLDDHSVFQLTNPDAFYFAETAVGVEGQALARLGSSCYLQPLNGKLSDSSNFELILWEVAEGACVGGGLRYHSSAVCSEVVEQFALEFGRLLKAVSQDPTHLLIDLALGINCPFTKYKRSQ